MWNNGIIMEPLNYKIAPKTFRCFVEDSHGCFQDMSHADKFLEILQYSLNFLHINITNNTNNKKHKFKVHGKDVYILI